MRLPRHLLFLLGLALVVPLAHAAPPATAALPENSVYRIPALTLRDQQGEVFTFDALRGEPRIVGMFYGSCQMACPLEIEYLKRLRHVVLAKSGRSIPVLLVTFDPARDDAAMLRKVAGEHHVQAPTFRLARPERGDEGMLAGVLGIAYRQLPGGGFGHNVKVSLLDAKGRIVASANASGTLDRAFVEAIVALRTGH